VLRAIRLGDCGRQGRCFILYVVCFWIGLLCCGLLSHGSAIFVSILKNFTHSLLLLFLFPRIVVVWLLLIRLTVRLPAFFRLRICTSFLLVLLLLRFRRRPCGRLSAGPEIMNSPSPQTPRVRRAGRLPGDIPLWFIGSDAADADMTTGGVNRAKGRGRGSIQSESGTAIATWSAGKGVSTYRIDMSTWRVVSQCFGNFVGTSLADALADLHPTRWRNVSTATMS
jgi:hypothetical protein